MGYGCSESAPDGASSTTSATQTAVNQPPRAPQGDKPDTSWLSPASCQPCHALGLPVSEPWDAIAIYPDIYKSSPLWPGEAEMRAGFSSQVPVDITVPEWEAWQRIIKDDDADKGKDCLSCHQAGDLNSDPPSLNPGLLADVPVSPRLKALHAWMHTPEDAIESTFGLWIKARTYRTLLVLTVKVLNYGSGHRSPSAPGSSVALVVDAVDSDNKPLAVHQGYRLPKEAAPHTGATGWLYAKLYAARDGGLTMLAKPGETVGIAQDTRLQGGEHDELHFIYLLPEKAEEGEPAWTGRARLIWRDGPGAPEKVIEESLVESPL